MLVPNLFTYILHVFGFWVFDVLVLVRNLFTYILYVFGFWVFDVTSDPLICKTGLALVLKTYVTTPFLRVNNPARQFTTIFAPFALLQRLTIFVLPSLISSPQLDLTSIWRRPVLLLLSLLLDWSPVVLLDWSPVSLLDRFPVLRLQFDQFHPIASNLILIMYLVTGILVLGSTYDGKLTLITLKDKIFKLERVD